MLLWLGFVCALAQPTPTKLPTPTPNPANASLVLASSPIHLSQTMRLLMIVGIPVNYDLRGAFTAPKGTTIRFSLDGLPKKSGIRLLNNGTLVGTPNATDLNAQQPMLLVLNAQSSAGNGTSSLVVTVTGKLPAANQTQAYFVYAGAPAAPINVSALFSDLKAPVRFTIQGLPKGSGLGLSSSGVVSGSPVGVDVTAKQPLQLLVTATDATRRNRTALIVLTVFPFAPPVDELPVPDPPAIDGYIAYKGVFVDVSEALAAYKGADLGYCSSKCSATPNCVAFNLEIYSGLCTLLKGIGTLGQGPTAFLYVRVQPAELVLVGLAFVNQTFSFNFSKAFPTNVSLNFGVAGLPKGTGLALSRGVLSGRPTAADANVKQPLLLNVTIKPVSPPNANATKLLFILIVAKTKPAGEVAGLVVTKGQSLQLPLAPAFNNSVNAYNVSGLPRGSQLTVDPRTGILQGVVGTEATAPQPVSVVVTGTNTTSKRSSRLTLLLAVLNI